MSIESDDIDYGTRGPGATKPQTPGADFDVAIIGAGPAGMTAAIYAARKNHYTCIFEGKASGGALATTTIVENYPGFSEIQGPELAERMEAQAKKFGTVYFYEHVDDLKRDGGAFVLTTGERTVKAAAVILATGAEYKHLGLAREEELTGHGISYCTTCDAPLFRGKTVAVVGGGNTAITSALLLAELCPKVYVVHRRNDFRAEEILLKRLWDSKGVEKVTPYSPTEFLGDKFITGLKIKHAETNEEKTLDVNGIFIHIGQTPATELAKKAGAKINERGFVEVNYNTMETNTPGFFVAGDLTGSQQQAAVSVGQGCAAALSAYAYLRHQK